MTARAKEGGRSDVVLQAHLHRGARAPGRLAQERARGAADPGDGRDAHSEPQFWGRSWGRCW